MKTHPISSSLLLMCILSLSSLLYQWIPQVFLILRNNRCLKGSLRLYPRLLDADLDWPTEGASAHGTVVAVPLIIRIIPSPQAILMISVMALRQTEHYLSLFEIFKTDTAGIFIGRLIGILG